MNRKRVFSSLALGLVLGALPALAQTPLFLDGTALGGSKVFSAGISPLEIPLATTSPNQVYTPRSSTEINGAWITSRCWMNWV